jgi:hypothetical protein
VLVLCHMSLMKDAIPNKKMQLSPYAFGPNGTPWMLSIMRVLLVLMAINLWINMPVLELKNNRKQQSPALFPQQKVALLRERLRIKKLALWNERTSRKSLEQ